MNVQAIRPSNLNSFEELKIIDNLLGETEPKDRTGTIISSESFQKVKKCIIGTTCFMIIGTGGSYPTATRPIFKANHAKEYSLNDVEELTDIFNDIEQDVKIVSDIKLYSFANLIDEDEIQEEIEIISKYMKNVKTYYTARKKKIII